MVPLDESGEVVHARSGGSSHCEADSCCATPSAFCLLLLQGECASRRLSLPIRKDLLRMPSFGAGGVSECNETLSMESYVALV